MLTLVVNLRSALLQWPTMSGLMGRMARSASRTRSTCVWCWRCGRGFEFLHKPFDASEVCVLCVCARACVCVCVCMHAHVPPLHKLFVT